MKFRDWEGKNREERNIDYCDHDLTKNMAGRISALVVLAVIAFNHLCLSDKTGK